MTVTELVNKLMDQKHPGWRDEVSIDEWDDAFRDPMRQSSFTEEWEIQGLKQFEEWLTQGQDHRK